jgi:hypothetical protein
VAVRHNVIVETLSKAPKTFEPIFARKPNRDIDAGPWCEGFYSGYGNGVTGIFFLNESTRLRIPGSTRVDPAVALDELLY